MRKLLARASVVMVSVFMIVGLTAHGASAATLTGPKPGKVTWNAKTNTLAAYNYKDDGWAIRAILTRTHKNSAFSQSVTDWAVDGKRQAIKAEVTNGKKYTLTFCYVRWDGFSACQKKKTVRG